MTLKQILSLVSSKLPPSFDRENVAAELWLGAWRRLKSQAVDPNEFTFTQELDPPLSASVIHNRCVDEMRKRSVEKNQDFAIQYDRSKEPVTATEVAEEPLSEHSDDFLERLLKQSQLSRQAQRVVMEKFFLGSSLKLIGEHLNLRPEEVQRILHQTLERLRAVARETKLETEHTEHPQF